VGCIPSKALLNSSHMFEHASKDFKHHGITVRTPPPFSSSFFFSSPFSSFSFIGADLMCGCSDE
jgi:hypothetical protein